MSNFSDFMIEEAVKKNQELYALRERATKAEAELKLTTEKLERLQKAAELDWKSERERAAVYATLEASVTVLKTIALYNARSPEANRLPDNIMRMVADVQHRLDEVTFYDKPTNS